MRHLNQAQVITQRRRLNQYLGVVLAVLLVMVVCLAYQSYYRVKQSLRPLAPQTIRIVRDTNQISLQERDGVWIIDEPYQHKASTAVVDALLNRLQYGCRPLTETPSRWPQFYADIIVDNTTYRIGELNAVSEAVYVAQDDALSLCDQLLAAMALAPAINFMDKQLYQGELVAIEGDFGRLTDWQGIDLSVLEVTRADAQALPQNSLSKLVFIADETRTYQVFLSDDSAHLLLFEPQQSIIYVIAANAKLNAILGL